MSMKSALRSKREYNLQARKSTNHTCRKKHLRYYCPGQEVSTFFFCIIKSQRLVQCFVKDTTVEYLLRCRRAICS